jgi:hypothetical protein
MITCGLVVAALGAAEIPHDATAAANARWVTLVDGTQANMNNFTPTGDVQWRAVNGALESTMGAGFLVTKNTYRDFQIRAEVFVSDDANSGIFIRCSDPAMPGAMTCYEVNLFDMRPEPEYATGAIVNYARVPPNFERAGGKWNVLEIEARGPQLTVRLNGKQTASVRDEKFAAGPFALQRTAGVVRFRKVEVRPL